MGHEARLPPVQLALDVPVPRWQEVLSVLQQAAAAPPPYVLSGVRPVPRHPAQVKISGTEISDKKNTRCDRLQESEEDESSFMAHTQHLVDVMEERLKQVFRNIKLVLIITWILMLRKLLKSWKPRPIATQSLETFAQSTQR